MTRAYPCIFAARSLASRRAPILFITRYRRYGTANTHAEIARFRSAPVNFSPPPNARGLVPGASPASIDLGTSTGTLKLSPSPLTIPTATPTTTPSRFITGEPLDPGEIAAVISDPPEAQAPVLDRYLVRQAALADRRHEPRRQARAEPPRAPDDHHLVAHAQRRIVTEEQGRVVARRRLEDGDVALLVVGEDPDDVQLAPVGEGGGDLPGVLDDVMVRDDPSVLRDEEAAPGCGLVAARVADRQQHDARARPRGEVGEVESTGRAWGEQQREEEESERKCEAPAIHR